MSFLFSILFGPLIIGVPIAVAIWLIFRLLNVKIGRQWITLIVGLIVILIILRSSDLTFYDKSTGIDRGTDWLTYRNEEYGFEIKYPPDWTYSSPGLIGKVEFCEPGGFADPNNPELGCEIRERTNAMSDTPRSMASIFLFIDTKDFNKPQNCTKITTDNGIEIFDCGSDYYWQNGDYFFQLATVYGFTSIPENKEIFYKMLSTFRFIDVLTEWKTYRNNDYNFVFKYPLGSVIIDVGTDRIILPIQSGTLLAEKFVNVIAGHECEDYYKVLVNESEAVSYNNVEFLKEVYGEGAAGNIYASERYTTIRNGKCISLEFVLHSVNPGNFDNPPPNFNKEEERKVFEQIMSTFMFLDLQARANE